MKSRSSWGCIVTLLLGSSLPLTARTPLRMAENPAQSSAKGAKKSAQKTPPANPNSEKKIKFIPQPEKRRNTSHTYAALLIGNADYKTDGAKSLKNPIHDARGVEAALKAWGFSEGDIQVVENGERTDMMLAIKRFEECARTADVRFFFYSGHGIQMDGVNYLVPPTFKGDAYNISTQMVPVQAVINGMANRGTSKSQPINIVILDACRNNPFKTAVPQKGLAQMKAPWNTMIVYAAQPGETADDNPDEKNGLYTQALLKSMHTPGLTLDDVFSRTGDAVFRESEAAAKKYGLAVQQPALLSTMSEEGRKFRFLPSEKDDPKPFDPHPTPAAEGVSLVSIPTNAQVFVEGIEQGRTPLTLPLPKSLDANGQITIRCTYPGYQEVTQEIKVGTARNQRLEITLPLISRPMNPRSGDYWINPIDGAAMVYVTPTAGKGGDSSSASTKTEPGFWMSVTPITVAQYERFVGANPGKKMPPAPDFNPDWSLKNHPIVNVTWQEANDYCVWANKMTLPTAAQWQIAALGRNAPSTQGELPFPWGQVFDVNRIAPKDREGTDDVEAREPNNFGLKDMVGNVSQWCLDAPLREPTKKQLRGGSWKETREDNFRCSYHPADGMESRDPRYGFRYVTR